MKTAEKQPKSGQKGRQNPSFALAMWGPSTQASFRSPVALLQRMASLEWVEGGVRGKLRGELGRFVRPRLARERTQRTRLGAGRSEEVNKERIGPQLVDE